MTTDTTPPATAGTHTGRTIVALAWPTGRSICGYTVQETADGADLYTRRLKAGHRAKAGDGMRNDTDVTPRARIPTGASYCLTCGLLWDSSDLASASVASTRAQRASAASAHVVSGLPVHAARVSEWRGWTECLQQLDGQPPEEFGS
jgi:hypothetical protein